MANINGYDIPDSVSPSQSMNGYNIPQYVNTPQPDSNSVSGIASDLIAATPMGSLAPNSGDIASAMFKGGVMGVKSVAATLAKAYAHSQGDQDTVQAIQNIYDQESKNYKNDPQVQQHNIAGSIGNMGGAALAMYPISRLAPGFAVGTVGSSLADLGAPAAVQAIGKGLTGVLANTAQGGLMGGLMTSPGQGQAVMNPKGMQFGMKAGALLGAFSPMLDSYANAATKYDQYATDLKNNVGYTGPIANNQVPGNVGWVGQTRDKVASALSNTIPGINSIPAIGTNPMYQAQSAALQDTVKNYINNMATKYPSGQGPGFINALQKQYNMVQADMESSANNFRQSLQDAGINSQDLTTEDLQNMYGTHRDDVVNNLQNSPDALAAYNNFSISTSTLKNMWSPENAPILAKAIKTINTNDQAAQTLYNQLSGNKLTANNFDRVTSAIGPDAMGAVQSGKLDSILNKNTTINTSGSPTINVSKLLNDINQVPDGVISPDTKATLNGLQSLAQSNQAKLAQTNSPASGQDIVNSMAKTGAVGALTATHPQIAAPILGTAQALAILNTHPILKQSLMNINRLTGNNPGTSQYLMNQALQQMGKVGILMNHTNNATNIQTGNE